MNQHLLIFIQSIAVFIFLILCARFLVKLTQKYSLTANHVLRHFSDHVFQLENGLFKKAQDLQPGHIITLRSGQLVPADAMLLSEYALLDTSMMNGETRLFYFTENLKLLAGYKLISGSARIVVENALVDSELSSLIKNSVNNVFINKSEKMAQWILFIFILVGIIFFVTAYPIIGYEEALGRVLALLAISGPCILFLGSPLTQAFAFGKARRLGITIRNPNIFEKLSNIKNIFFNKTGTLTEGILKIESTWPENISLEVKKLILDLQKKSNHPAAFALRNAWLDEVNENKIVSLITDQEVYEIKTLSDSIHNNQLALGLFKNKIAIARIYFTDPLRTEASEILTLLRKLKFDIFVLSGDRKHRSLSVASRCGVHPDNVYYELFPEDKEDIIQKFNSTLMIGDSLNDTLAISKSDVGISLRSAYDLDIHSSDITFFRGGLKPLLDLFRIQRQTISTLNRNLAIALTYLTVSGLCALAGLVSPMVAAVLIPMSIGLVLLSSYWGFR